ncbi:rhodanese-like domain-containing protein [Helicobacter sp. 23-1044]
MKKALNLGEFKQKMDSAIIIDVRARGYFLIDHIKDAINVESPTRIAFIAQENADKDIILYCHHGVTARGIAEALNAQNVYFLDANFSDIVKSGIEIVFYSKN